MPEDNNNSGGDTNNSQPVDFGKWLETQPDDVRSLVDGHIKGLITALGSEREARKSFEKQVRDLASKAEAGSEAQKQLTALADQNAALNRQQAFYDEAHTRGVNNLKLAYLAAKDSGLIDDQGRVNWEQMKQSFPQLFGATAGSQPSGNAGSGTQQSSGKPDMNKLIRRAAGYSE